jgi:hypothetical protein
MRAALARAAHSPRQPWPSSPLRPARAARALCTTRRASAPAPPDKDASKAFASTLLLPATPFPLYPKPETEGAFRAVTSDALYRWQAAHNTGAPFIVHDGPPYANGAIHMGAPRVCRTCVSAAERAQGTRSIRSSRTSSPASMSRRADVCSACTRIYARLAER